MKNRNFSAHFDSNEKLDIEGPYPLLLDYLVVVKCASLSGFRLNAAKLTTHIANNAK